MDWLEIISRVIGIYLGVSILYIMAHSGMINGYNNFKQLSTNGFWKEVKWDFIIGFISCVFLVMFNEGYPFVIYQFFVNIFLMLIFIIISDKLNMEYKRPFMEKINNINKLFVIMFFSFLLIPYLLIFKKKV